MNSGVRQFWAGLAIAIAIAGCGGSGSKTATSEEICQAICANEAKLSCPNGDEAGCVAGCSGLLVQDKQTFPNCIAQFDALFSCTGRVATTSIHCSTTGSSPDYDPGFCAAESATLASCTAAGAACNTVANTATTIDRTQVAEVLPTADAAGGTFAPGTYFRTSTTVYTGVGGATGPNGLTDKQTLVVSAASSGAGAIVAQSAQSKNGGADEHGTLMGTPAGTTVTLVISCPVNAPFASFPYTATATGFTLYNTLENIVEVYAKQ